MPALMMRWPSTTPHPRPLGGYPPHYFPSLGGRGEGRGNQKRLFSLIDAHFGVIVRKEITDHDTHGAVGALPAGGVVVDGGDSDSFVPDHAVSSAIEKSHDGYGPDSSLGIQVGDECRHRFVPRGIDQVEPEAVIGQVSAHAKERSGMFEREPVGCNVRAGLQVIPRVVLPPFCL
jgi:hypothetical protein